MGDEPAPWWREKSGGPRPDPQGWWPEPDNLHWVRSPEPKEEEQPDPARTE